MIAFMPSTTCGSARLFRIRPLSGVLHGQGEVPAGSLSQFQPRLVLRHTKSYAHGPLTTSSSGEAVQVMACWRPVMAVVMSAALFCGKGVGCSSIEAKA